jgi:hypothetical protein
MVWLKTVLKIPGPSHHSSKNLIPEKLKSRKIFHPGILKLGEFYNVSDMMFVCGDTHDHRRTSSPGSYGISPLLTCDNSIIARIGISISLKETIIIEYLTSAP